MPVQVKAFACAYRCGEPVKISWKAVASHETRCFSNPDRRACRTCVHYSTEQDEDGGGEYCAVIKDFDKKRFDCPKYKPKENSR